MLIDIVLFLYCSSVILSFSVFLFDGYLLFCLIWIFSLFYSITTNAAALPEFARLVWFILISSMLLGRFLYSHIFRQGGFPQLETRITSSLSNESNISVKSLRIKPIIFKYFIISCVILLFLSITGFGQNPEVAGSVNAVSKSRVPYVIDGFLQALLSYWTFSILFASRYVSSSINSKFLNQVLPFRLLFNLTGSLQFSAYLASYATKFVAPLLDYLFLRFYMKFSWSSIRSSVSRLKLSSRLLFFILSSFVILTASSFLVAFLSVDLLQLILLKITIRSDAYSLLDQDALAMLSNEYGGNLFYFVHPFLKSIGFQAYDMPMGSFLIANGSDLSVTGGPNIHLPLVLYILGGGGFSGFVLIIFLGVIFSLILCHARTNIVLFVNNPTQSSSVFWSIFFFNSFLLLLQEPSAFGHVLFFAFLVYLFLRFLKPSLFNILA